MSTLLLFPSDYFDIRKVDANYKDEYNEVAKFPEFETAVYDYEEFITNGKLSIYPNNRYRGTCVYRGWMLTPLQYEDLYKELLDKGLKLINSPVEYNECHLFPNVYDSIKSYTPKSIYYQDQKTIDWVTINRSFKRFMVKDYVKSVKGSSFPDYFETPVVGQKMDYYIQKFIELRANLYTGGIVIKEFVDLKKYFGFTNEYRAFFLNGELVSLCRNSNQPNTSKIISRDFVQIFKSLKSKFYTVDFAELDDGSWGVIETGDGQVSGLSSNQNVFKYYDEIRKMLESEKI
ncbi:hypothetical protein CN887_28645 [Bacillus pseudomycoides]|uniref:ATP-grasp domain-containing protein n=1 Tax=Bacillus pseudomycoides TaxID=64104 RepID=UPI000BF0A698|nr:ATP-grasp domain-containing protein [Bacillus pseudomycoides]PEJ19572.1 hypothetical protein CN887_28645 [Bacillus pseudomycoides]PHG31108.1 hypothetical protein COI43_14545 [Bacillus pseudomycoides]